MRVTVEEANEVGETVVLIARGYLQNVQTILLDVVDALALRGIEGVRADFFSMSVAARAMGRMLRVVVVVLRGTSPYPSCRFAIALGLHAAGQTHHALE